jgi:endo-1,4-beta-xylanase
MTDPRTQHKLAVCMALSLAAVAPLAAQTTLRQAAAPRAIPVGAAASADEYGPPDLLQDPTYANLLSSQYSMLEPANAMKWDVTQPTQTTYNFQPGDELVAFAQANGMRVRGTICAGISSSRPGWRPMRRPLRRNRWPRCCKTISRPK